MSEPHDAALTLMSGEGTEAVLHAAVDHVRACAACQAELTLLGKSVDALLGSNVAPMTARPSGEALQQLMIRVRAGRLSYFTAQVAELFDLSMAAAADLLRRAETEEAWEEGPAEGVKLLVVNCGPRVPEALTALVKVEPGATFPTHPHFGAERVLVIEGGYTDSMGREVWRGEVHDMSPDSEHSFTAFERIGCVCASVNALVAS